MGNLTVPDEMDEWPHDARQFVLAEANTMVDLRREIDSIVGLPSEYPGEGDESSLTKQEAAAIILALGGPQEDSDGGP